MKKRIKEIAALLGAVTVIIGFITWGISSAKQAISPVQDYVQTVDAELQSHSKALIDLFEYVIARAHREYMKQGEIDRLALLFVHDMYESYRAVRYNPFIEQLMHEIKQLPIVTEYD